MKLVSAEYGVFLMNALVALSTVALVAASATH